MSNDLNTEIKIGADASGVEAGVGRAKRSLADLGQAAKRTGKEGADGITPIGEGADKAAQKVEAATRNTVASIQRQIASFEAGSKSSREYQEALARMRGVDVGALKPYLDQLDAAKAKSEAAANASGTLANSINNLKTVAIGAAAIAGAFALMVGNINNGVDALNDLKDATGASIENISGLEDIARRTGTGFDTVGSSLIKLNQTLANSKPGSDTDKALKGIGLSVKELKSLDPAEAFRRIAVSLSGFADDGNKARLTQELFGKSLKEVAPLLNDVAAAGKLTGTVTTAQAEAAEKLNKQIFSLQKNALDLGRAFTGTLVPALSEGVDRFLLAYKNAGSLLGVLGLYSRLDYSKNIQGNLGVIEQQIASLEDRAKRITSDSVKRGNDKVIADLKAQANYLKELRQTQLLASQGDTSDAVSRKYLDKAKPSAPEISTEVIKKNTDALRENEERIKLNRAAVIAQGEALMEANNAYQKSLQDDLKARDKYNETFEKSAEAVARQINLLNDEEEAHQLAAATNITLAQAVEKVATARLNEALAIELSYGNDTAANSIRNEIELRKKLADAIDIKDARKANEDNAKDVAKAMTAEWQRGWEETDRLGREVFTSWATEGGNAADKIGDSLKKALLSAIYEATLKPLALQIYSAVAGGAPGTGSGTAGAGGTGSGGSSIFTDFAGSIAGKTDQFGQFLINNSGNSQAVGDFGASLVSNSKQIGAYAEKASSILSYLEIASNFKDGSYGKSIGQGVGMAIGGPIGGQIGKEIGGLVDKLFAKGEYVASTGDANVAFNATGGRTRTSTAAEIGGGRYEATLTAGADKLVSDLNATYLASIKALGGSAKFTDFFFGGNNSDGGKFTLGSGVGGVGAVFNSGEQKTSDEAVKLAASRAVFAALQSSTLPGYISKVFDGISASSATQGQIDTALEYAGSLKQIRDALTETRTPLQIMQAQVADAFSNLGTSAETFKTDFVAAIDAGISPDKLAQFQALGVGLDTLAAAAGKAGEGVRTLADIATERTNLQNQLDQLTLSSTQLLGKQRDALDASNASLFDQVQAATAAKAALTERAGLQQQLDALTLTSTELLAQQRGALDESNRALFDQVQAATAAKTAQDKLAESALAMAARISSAFSTLGDTRFGLENQLLGLQGNSAAAAARTRERDLANLTKDITDKAQIDQITAAYDYNAGLQVQIEALTASKAAAEENARAQQQAADSASNAASQITSAWQSVTNSLFDEVARIRGQMAGNGGQGAYAAAQAQFSITAAQAEAGSQTAAKALPELSRALLGLAQQDAASLADLSFIQASTAGTLEAISKKFASQFGLNVPQFAAGTNYIPQDMLAVVHQGEAIIPAAYNPASGVQGNTARLESLVAVLIAKVEALEAPMSRTADATEDAAGTLGSVTEGGNAMRSVVMEPIPV